MPIIPRGTENVRMNVSSPVPVASTTDARFSGESMAAAGKAVEEFGRQQLEFNRSLKKSEAENALRNANKESLLYADQSAKEDGSDYVDKFKEKFGEFVPSIMSQHAGNDPRLQKQVGSMTKIVSEAGMTDALIGGAARMEKYNWNRQQTVNEDRAKRVESTPSPQNLAAELVSLHASDSELLMNKAMSADNVYKSSEAAKGMLAKGYISGLVRNKDYGTALDSLQASQEYRTSVSEFDPKVARDMGLITGPEADSLVEKGQKYTMPLYTKGDKVKLTPEVAQVMQALTPAERTHFIDKILAERQSEMQVKMSDIHASMEGFKTLAESGNYGSQFLDKKAAEIKQDLNANSALSIQGKARAHAQVDAYQVIGQQMSLAKSMPASQRDSLIHSTPAKIGLLLEEGVKYDPRLANMKNDVGVLGIKEEAKDRVEKSLSLLKAAEEKDGAAAALAAFPGLRQKLLAAGDRDSNSDGVDAYQKYLSSLKASQEYLGIKNVRVTTVQEAAKLAGVLNGIQDPAQLENQVILLERQYGEHFPKIMEEVGKSDKKLKDLKMVAYAPEEGRQRLLEAIKLRPAIEEDFKNKFGESAKEINTQIAEHMQPFQSVLMGSANNVSSLEWVNSLSNQIELGVKRELSRSPDKDVKDAVKEVYKEVVDGSYYLAKGGNSKTLVPKKIDGKPIAEGQLRVFDAYIGMMSDKKAFEKLGVAIPPSYAKMTKEEYSSYQLAGKEFHGRVGAASLAKDFAPDTSLSTDVMARSGEEVYLDQLQARHKWVPNKDLTGIRLVTVNPRNGSVTPVYNKSGKEIEKSYKDIYLNPGKDVEKMSQSIVGRLFGF